METFYYYCANQMEAFTAVSVSWDFHIMHCLEFYLFTEVGCYLIFCPRNFSLFLRRWNVFFKANLAFFFKLLPVISCVKAKHNSSYQVLYNCVFDSAVFHLSQDLPELEEVEIVPVTPAGVSSFSLHLSSLSPCVCVFLCLPVCLGVTIKS